MGRVGGIDRVLVEVAGSDEWVASTRTSTVGNPTSHGRYLSPDLGSKRESGFSPVISNKKSDSTTHELLLRGHIRHKWILS